MRKRLGKIKCKVAKDTEIFCSFVYNQNLNPTQIKLSISGWTGAKNVIIIFRNYDGTTLTLLQSDNNGFYEYKEIPCGWSGKVIPSLAGYTFNPPERVYTNLKSSLTDQNFYAYKR